MRLKHFASRDGMDIETFSEKTADLFYDELNVRDPADLYHLAPENLVSLKGFGDKKVRNLFEALEKSKHCPLDRFLLAIGIPNVGKRTARDLAIRFGTLEGLKAADAGTLAQVDDIGDIIAESIIAFFGYPENQEMTAPACGSDGSGTDPGTSFPRKSHRCCTAASPRKWRGGSPLPALRR